MEPLGLILDDIRSMNISTSAPFNYLWSSIVRLIHTKSGHPLVITHEAHDTPEPCREKECKVLTIVWRGCRITDYVAPNLS